MINLNMNLREVAARWSAFVTEIAMDKYGHAPQIKVLYFGGFFLSVFSRK